MIFPIKFFLFELWTPPQVFICQYQVGCHLLFTSDMSLFDTNLNSQSKNIFERKLMILSMF